MDFGGARRDPYGRDIFGFSASTEINREDYGLVWNVAAGQRRRAGRPEGPHRDRRRGHPPARQLLTTVGGEFEAHLGAAVRPGADVQRAATGLGRAPGDVHAPARSSRRRTRRGAAPRCGRRSRDRSRPPSGSRRRPGGPPASPPGRCRRACARTRCPAARPAPRPGRRPAPPPGSGASGSSRRTARSVSSASTVQNATRSATTAVASQPAAGLSAAAPAGLLDHRGDRAFDAVRGRGDPGRLVLRSRSDSASSRSAVSGVRSRCDRSATCSRSSRSRSWIRPARWLSARGHLAHLAAARPGLGPGGQFGAGQPVRDRGQVGDRRHDGAGQPVGDQQPEQHQGEAQRGQHQPGPGHPAGQLARRCTTVRTTVVCPPDTTGTTISRPPSSSRRSTSGRCASASRTAGVRSAAVPEHRRRPAGTRSPAPAGWSPRAGSRCRRWCRSAARWPAPRRWPGSAPGPR